MLIILVVLLGYLGTHGVNCEYGEVCPDGWTRFQASCYYLGFEQSYHFVEAAHFCQQHHANLVNVETATEDAFVKDYLKKTHAGDTWLGLSDIDVEGIWRWYSNDELVNYTDWAPGQPASDHGEEDCAYLSAAAHYTWHDAPCTRDKHPLCEKVMNEGEPGIIG